MKTQIVVMGAAVLAVAIAAVVMVRSGSSEASGPTGLREERHCTAEGTGVAICQPPAGETWFVTAASVRPLGTEGRLVLTDGATDAELLNTSGGVLTFQGSEIPITNAFYLKGTQTGGANPTKLLVAAYVETKAAQAVGGIAEPSPVASTSPSPDDRIAAVVLGVGPMTFAGAGWFVWRSAS